MSTNRKARLEMFRTRACGIARTVRYTVYDGPLPGRTGKDYWQWVGEYYREVCPLVVPIERVEEVARYADAEHRRDMGDRKRLYEAGGRELDDTVVDAG